MKKRDFENKKLKHQLRSYKEKGKKYLVWKLNKEQIEYIQGLGYRVEPFLYTITTKTFPRIRTIKYPIIKDVHYNCKRGKRTFTQELNDTLKEILNDFGVKFRVSKYKIFLV